MEKWRAYSKGLAFAFLQVLNDLLGVGVRNIQLFGSCLDRDSLQKSIDELSLVVLVQRFVPPIAGASVFSHAVCSSV